MRLPSDQLDSVYDVLTPIPLIGAQPGDELVFHPGSDQLPFALLRRLEPEIVAAIPARAVRFIAAYEPHSHVPMGQGSDEAEAERPTLTLVR